MNREKNEDNLEEQLQQELDKFLLSARYSDAEKCELLRKLVESHTAKGAI